jgi:hypothetical protein
MQDSPTHTLTDSAYRAIFSECYELWLECRDGSTGRVRARVGHVDFGRPVEEFLSDVVCLARRTLTIYELVLFTRAYILRWNAHRCCNSLRIDRLQFYMLAEGIQTKLGRAFAENGMRPGDYFRPDGMSPLPTLDPRPHSHVN